MQEQIIQQQLLRTNIEIESIQKKLEKLIHKKNDLESILKEGE